MAKKSPSLGAGVDFIVRTMMEREASGKRKIRPKNVEDVLLPEDSDDSDYDYVGEDADLDEDDSVEDNTSQTDSSDGSNEESETDEDSSEEGSDNNGSSESDDEDKTKKSALRDTLKRMNDTPASFSKPKKKRKRPPPKSKVNVSTTNTSSINVNSSSVEASKSKSASGGVVVQNGPSSANKKTPSRRKTKVNKSRSNGSDGVSRSKSKKKSSVSRKKKKKKKEKKSKYNSVSNLLDKLDSLQSEGRKEINVDHHICWFCLGDKSDETNEIIECDACGITVHEACYGVSDNVSVSSGTESSNSTEPWFCDACKSGLKNITCELCPAKGGLYKETTTGRWVHLICAMYIPGIRVADDGTPNMLELSYSNWGYYLCTLCEEERDARIGITIRCDAGLCKTYIHATCAHKAGLLSDPTVAGNQHGEVADPYYAACKMHTNREMARRRAESYKVLCEQIRIRQDRKRSENLTESEKLEQTRIQTKIEKIRSKVAAKFFQNNLVGPSILSSLPPSLTPNTPSQPDLPLSWKEGTKKPRMLHTTPLVDKFLSKAAIIGHDLRALELEDKHERIASNVKRKWNIQPALSVEYAAYYADREIRLSTLADQCEKLEKDKIYLIDQHAGMKSVYEDLEEEHKAQVEEEKNITKTLESLREILTLLSPTNQNLNRIVVPKRRHSSSVGRKSPAAKRDRRSSPNAKRSKAKAKSSPVNGSQSPTGRLRIVKCAVCSNSEDQHLITRCDKCKKNYHLGCLDPPLSRMPKKSRTFGWMCSDCGDESEESDSPQVDTEAPRTLRGRENLKKPNKYRGGGSPIASNHVGGGNPKSGKSPGSSRDHKDSPGSNWPSGRHLSNSQHSASDSSISSTNEGKCHTCTREDFKKNLVMCDKCYLEFHFLCLQPPLKYSPKRRGYSWFCANCDEASSVDSHHSLKVCIDPMEEEPLT